MCASENSSPPLHDRIWQRSTVSPRPSHACASVCVYSSLCAQSWPEGQTDVVNTSQCPLRIGPATQAEKHALCTQDKPLHHDTSAVVGDAHCPLSPLRVLATAERPPGNPSVIVMAGRPMTSRRLNKWNGAQKEKYSASSNIKLSLTDELETRSCFISSRLQSSSPLLYLDIWEHCPYAPLTLTTGFFSRKDRNRL